MKILVSSRTTLNPPSNTWLTVPVNTSPFSKASFRRSLPFSAARRLYVRRTCPSPSFTFRTFATKERQEAARELSGRVDAMLVIGGTSSSNTRKLYEICSEKCRNTYFIQTKEDLENSDFSRFDYVGITAGASTPNNIIEEVQKYVRNEF